MDKKNARVQTIADTAFWAAMYRAKENTRPDALFRDPFAGRLEGERGQQIADSMPESKKSEWSWAIRTYLFDKVIMDQINKGTDIVINLGAGLDARPYRMNLPPSLKWIEVDLPDLITYKSEILKNEKPVCHLQRIPLDLSDIDARQKLFTELDTDTGNVLIITEGLLIYLTAEEVGALARDLLTPKSFKNWVIDLVSPGLLKMMERITEGQLEQAGSPFKFSPEAGPDFFRDHGWNPIEVHSLLKNAARLKRVSWLLRLVALLPESKKKGSSPWSATCLLSRK